MVTLALRRSRFSSCSALHFNLNVSSSIFSTLFSCCNDASRFVSSSSRDCEITTPCALVAVFVVVVVVLEAAAEVQEDCGVAELLLLPAPSVSLSLALSAMVSRARYLVLATDFNGEEVCFRGQGERGMEQVWLLDWRGNGPRNDWAC